MISEFNFKILTNNLKIIVFFLICNTNLFAQENGSDAAYNNNHIRYQNYIYKPNIKTVICEPTAAKLMLPMFDLYGDATLTLKFDDLDADFKNYNYTIQHCTPDWQPSDIVESDFVTGFNNERISNYKTSFNTLVKYTHYELTFPNENLKPMISGNYILTVFQDDDKENRVLTQLFMVFENVVTIAQNIHRATNPELRSTSQEIDFVINLNKLFLPNPFTDLKTVILQNGRWDNAIKNLRPQFIRTDELEYNYDKENVFEGGNQFRRFDTRSIRYQTEFIKDIAYNDSLKMYDVVLLPSQRRSAERYVSEEDINGKYLIKYQEGNNDDLEADYVNVTFSLKNLYGSDSSNVYVFGALTNWELSPANRMKYVSELGLYYYTTLLKQGYYNYALVTDDINNSTASFTEIEGNHWETENEYTILVYHQPTNKRYSSLIGVQKISSSRIY